MKNKNVLYILSLLLVMLTCGTFSGSKLFANNFKKQSINVFEKTQAVVDVYKCIKEQIVPAETNEVVVPKNYDLVVIASAVRSLAMLDVENMWLDPQFTYNYDGKSYKLTLKSKYTVIEYEEKLSALYAETEKIIQQINGTTEREKLIQLYNVLYKNVLFDVSGATTVYDCLVKQQCNCQGFAYTYQYISRLLGIEVGLVFGDCYGGSTCTKIDKGLLQEKKTYIDATHVWNYVNIAGQMYYVDVSNPALPILATRQELDDCNYVIIQYIA